MIIQGVMRLGRFSRGFRNSIFYCQFKKPVYDIYDVSFYKVFPKALLDFICTCDLKINPQMFLNDPEQFKKGKTKKLRSIKKKVKYFKKHHLNILALLNWKLTVWVQQIIRNNRKGRQLTGKKFVLEFNDFLWTTSKSIIRIYLHL